MIYTTLYTIAFVLSFAMLLYMIAHFHFRNMKYHLAIASLIAISNFGQVIRSLSYTPNANMVYSGDMLIFVDGTIMLSFVVLFCLYIAKVKVPYWLKTTIIAIGVATYLCTISEGWTSLFLTPITNISEYGVSVAYKLGPIYCVVGAHMVVCLSAVAGTVAYAIKNKHTVSFKYPICMLSIVVIGLITFVVQTVANTEIKLLPFAFVASEPIIIYVLFQVRKHDVNVNSVNSILSKADVTNIAFDFDRHYLGVEYFNSSFRLPDVTKLMVDRAVPDDAKFFYEVIFPLLDQYENDTYEPMVYSQGKKKYLITIKEYYMDLKKAPIGYIVTIKEDTNAQVIREREMGTNDRMFELDDMICALCGIYRRVSYIDVKEDTFLRIKVSDESEQTMVTFDGAQERLNQVVSEYSCDIHREQVLEFVNLSTINERLFGVNEITLDIQSCDKTQWARLKWTVSERDEFGLVWRLFYTSQDVTCEYQK